MSKIENVKIRASLRIFCSNEFSVGPRHVPYFFVITTSIGNPPSRAPRLIGPILWSLKRPEIWNEKVLHENQSRHPIANALIRESQKEEIEYKSN